MYDTVLFFYCSNIPWPQIYPVFMGTIVVTASRRNRRVDTVAMKFITSLTELMFSGPILLE